MAYVRRVALRPTLADLSGEDNELSMYYRRTIPAPLEVRRSYPGATHLEIKGASRSGYYSIFVKPESVGPTVVMGISRPIVVPRAIVSSIPAHRIHESYGVWPDNPDSTD